MSPLCRLLLIEDDHAQAQMLERACCPDPTAAAVDVVNNGAAAEDAIRSREYDLIVCDLALPLDDRRLDPETTEGMRLFQLVRDVAPGTPVIVLSGHADLQMLQPFLSANRSQDLFGTGVEEALVQFYAKENLPDCVDAVKTHLAKMAVVDALQLEVSGAISLSLSDQRALRIYGRRTGAVGGTVTPLDGGLSDSKTLRVTLRSAGGTVTGSVVAKLSDLANVQKEMRQYQQLSPKLFVGLGATVLDVVEAGAGQKGALIYQLADEHTESLFGLLAKRDPLAVTATDRLMNRLRDWAKDAPVVTHALSDLRRPLVTDVELSDREEPIPNERDVEVAIHETMAHGDLHGLNVLVNPQGDPTLIDYGEVRRANAGLDPITLELSIVFHPAMFGQLDGWPTEDQAVMWHDLSKYLEGCPVAEFVRLCRRWAKEVCTDEREMLATAYSYALRQLKFADASGPIARAIAWGAYTRLAGAGAR